MAREYHIDIHDYDRKILQAVALVQHSSLSDRNKQLILSYRDVCLRLGLCGEVRLIRVMGALSLFGRMLNKDFDTVTKTDLEQLVSVMLRASPAYSPETMGTYRAILKKFMTWVLSPDDFPTREPPLMVVWLKSGVRSKDKRRLQRRDIVTAEEAARLIGAANNARDRALISLLWETGARIAEIGNLQIKHITKHPNGFLLDLNGKTGGRNPLVVSSAPHLSMWLAYHPFNDNPEAPLWVYERQCKTPQYIRYQTMRKILQSLYDRAGIKKRPNPHGLRHARTTHLVGTGLMNEAQAKVYLGWSASSKMLGTYSHLTSGDANNAILAENNLSTARANTSALTIRICQFCENQNIPTAQFCTKCTNPLDEKTAHAQRENPADTQALILQLCQVLVQKGLLDEATAHIHNAGLGPTLKALATQTKR